MQTQHTRRRWTHPPGAQFHAKPEHMRTLNSTPRVSALDATTVTLLLIMVAVSRTAGTELISNGGFESGSTGWTFAGGAAVSNNGGFARSGSYFLWLGGAVNEVDSAYQTVTIPPNATAASLTFYWNI